MLKITICTLVVAYLVYLSYLDYTGEEMNSALAELFNHVLFRLAILVGVAVLAFHKHLVCSLLLAVAYLLSVSMANRCAAKEAFTEMMTNPGVPAPLPATEEEEDTQTEPFTGNEAGCGPYAPADSGFNPHPFRPNESVMGSGVPDPLPPVGDNFHSDPSGPYADSGVAYQMDMA